ncbi:hypothetical protein Tco_1182197 [Tanacetum coccineum]
MTSPQAFHFKPYKKPKFTIIPPKQLFIDLTKEDTTTPSPKFQVSSPSAPNAPSKTPSNKKGTHLLLPIDYTPKITSSLIISLTNGKEVVLAGFSDSNYGGCLDSGKSTTGYVFIVGGIAVRWMSRIQKYVAMSTTEAEYMAITEAGKELVWLNNFLEELDRAQTECRTLSLKKILGAKNPADMLTKVVTTEKLKLCAASIGLRDN